MQREVWAAGTALLPTANGPGVRRRTLVTVGVHSGQRSTSRIVAQTSSAYALISVSILERHQPPLVHHPRPESDRATIPAAKKDWPHARGVSYDTPGITGIPPISLISFRPITAEKLMASGA